jgi:hypothetical protein
MIWSDEFAQAPAYAEGVRVQDARDVGEYWQVEERVADKRLTTAYIETILCKENE